MSKSSHLLALVSLQGSIYTFHRTWEKQRLREGSLPWVIHQDLSCTYFLSSICSFPPPLPSAFVDLWLSLRVCLLE